MARAELQTVLGISAAPAHVCRPRLAAGDRPVHARAPPALSPASARWQRGIRGLWLCGTSYDGVSFNDAIKSGRLTAQRVAEQAWGAGASRGRARPRCGGGASVSERRHVVLVTYGEPPTPSFVDQLVYSWRILLGLTRTVAAIPAPVVPLIALSRARGGTGCGPTTATASPLEALTRAAGRAPARDAGRRRRAATGACTSPTSSAGRCSPRCCAACPAASRCGWRRCTPPTRRSRTRCRARRCASSPRGAARRRRSRCCRRSTSPGWPTCRPHTSASITADDGWHGPDVALVLAAHGTLLAPEKPIATGLAATEALRQAIAARLAPRFGLVVHGWLNHTRGGRWTEPPIEAALRRRRGGGLPPHRLLPVRLPRRQRRERARRTDRAGRPSGDHLAPSAVLERLDAADGGDRRSGAQMAEIKNLLIS